MRVPPLVAGLACAFATTLLLLPVASAVPAGPLADLIDDPFGYVHDQLPDPLVGPLPGPLSQTSFGVGDFCVLSSYIPSFCVLGVDVVEAGPPRAAANVSGLDWPPAPAMEEPPVALANETVEEPLRPPHQMADSGAPGPREPEPPIEVPRQGETAGLAPKGKQSSLSTVEWAVLGAALALPWALGMKVLATLMGLRRASHVGREEAGRPSRRGAVLEAVQREPGIRHSDLVARIGRGNGTVEHHVRALLAEGQLARVRGLGSTLYFLKGALPEAEARMRLALQGSTSRRMAALVAARPGIRLGEVARAAGISGATAHYQAGKLVRAGILCAEPGPGRRLTVTAEGAACLAALPGGPMDVPVPASSQGGAFVPGAAVA
ncbi:MAG TPA: hypothetical protein VM327_10840 [Candidatus Thermoplasmatota archaeon]|nr:hypothetical protein [Candidatus Thermoplasmatota archaeon]